MRILSIRFKNLNSLAGEWEVDLTHPAFTGDGLFAITGPTGAGKSTLLDAVCLALYGQTPRQPRISQAQNEVMSRQTGECFAEVVFETPQGRWRCHWSQHRSRKQPDGSLQPPRQELSEADSGRLLASKIRDVAERIEQLSGMDFERFTRSMLLAQGSFAAFLQAAPDERAPILEQITGTSIYSDISVAVHRRRGEERQALEQLQAAQSGLQLLDEEEEAALGRELAQVDEQAREQQQQVDQQQQLLNWRQQLDQESQQLAQLQQQQSALQQEQQAFEPQQQSLERAQRAEALRPAYEPLRQRRDDLHRVETRLAELAAGVPALQQRYESACTQQAQVQQTFEHAEAEYERQQPLLRQLHEQDWKLREQQAKVNELKAALPAELLEAPVPDAEQMQRALQQSEQALEALLAGSTRPRLQAQQDEVRSRGEQLSELRNLVRQREEWRRAIEGFNARVSALKPEQSRVHQLIEQDRRDEARLLQEQQDLQKMQRLAERIADLEQQRQELEPGKPCPLCGSEEHPWRSETPPQMNAERARLQAVDQRLAELRTGLQQSIAQQARLEQDEQGLRQQQEEHHKRCEAMEPALKECLEGLELAVRPSLEDVDSLHQSARQQWGELRDRLAEVDRLEQQIKQQQEEQARLQQRLALESAQEALNTLQQQRRELSTEPDTRAFEMRLQQSVRQSREQLEQARQQVSEHQQALNRRQQQLSDLEGQQTALRTDVERMQQAFAQALAESLFGDEAALQAALMPETERTALQQAADRLKERSAHLHALMEQSRNRLALLREQALTEQSAEALENHLQQLKAEQAQRLEQRGSLQRALNDNEIKKQQFGAQQKAIEAQLRELERWELLHELIGSADGKKFRNFAQGLTFELMVSHANRQLQKMSDRYLLVRDSEQPLELNVVDNYQAGEVRSTKNLSGGESFLISLALALGLSGMASQNVRVDSLFLDEGFGTLDEEALETALDTLAGLQQEGKLIGVISHVQALKDRIATRIEVTPLSGGRSRLDGPGCRSLA
ncbi:AAA family ATPase [Marinobacterium sp. AK62]|uniref:AAA family ATPase n=1 Tax=Marinobacterium alkalitolerans TaxID=1542925 RepID=A0ABS3Z8I7_9GAMM|nr:AAA family ATPase [Marinobacterium alkalitolerans]MBP0048004.1 AAA family ATPase [Marinobacterium alkalitolerans]